MAQRRSVGDDLDLSLTGSQISARSSSRRPGSAGQMKRPNSMADIRTSKSVVDKNRPASNTGDRSHATSQKVPVTPTSHRSGATVSTNASKTSRHTENGRPNDFLSFFDDSTQPKIKRPSSTASSSSKTKKPSANAVKVLWQDSPFKGGMQLSPKPLGDKGDTAGNTDRSEGPHNIFRPDSALTNSDDDDLDNIEETLSQSISKLQSLQSQLSGINKNNSANGEASAAAADALNSYRSSDSTPRNPTARSTPRNTSAPQHKQSHVNGLANNMTSQAQKQKTKASLSSIENSYQNIKHKTPVNQVRTASSTAQPAVSQINHNVAEEYIQTLNKAATTIQLWFRRHLARHRAGKAAMRRLLQQKKAEREDLLRQSAAGQDDRGHRPDDKKKLKEEKARQARQEAIQPATGDGGDEEDEKQTNGPGDSATQTGTRTTLNDLYDTLRKLEEEENLVTPQAVKKPSWLDDLEKDQEEGKGSNLTAENLEKLNASKDELTKSGALTDDKLKSIMSFLDEVQVSDRLSEIDTEIHRMNEELEKPALLVPSGEELEQIEKAQAMASEVTNTVLSQRLELDEKSRTVTMLQRALNQQRELTVRHARETDKEMKRRLDMQKEEYEEAIKRHLSFIDQLIDDKKSLSEKCEQLVKELKTVDRKYQDKIKSLEESHAVEMTKIKEIQAAAEKLRREKWIDEKTKKIKEMTVKGLEPEIQRLIAKHKAEIKKIKQVHEAELLEADERAAQRYVKMTEELRDQLAQEKEAACARERELAKERQVQEEKDRVATSASRQRQELDTLRRQLEDSHRVALNAMREQFEKAREEQERRHNTEVRELQERLQLEKEAWEENYRKKHDTWLAQKERELKEQVRKERDKEIELVIARLEEDSCAAREESEKSAETKIRRLREKFEVETRELENSERRAVQKYNEIKARATEVEGENERLKVIIKQKDEEIRDSKKLIDKMREERGHVSDIIRQEFADRIVATEEENRRIKNEISELRAKHRIELERAKQEVEDIKKVKDEEMEEVHKRVKQAIVKKEEVVNQLRQQYQAACKRADHLEGLLEQQRKQLLKK
ncbi:hypothetical protein BaRGS_00002494 [Batillaria attramentaria]|uniref:Centrosomal protein of 131 kDa n=1 Tax=Batillaria attramentaria TaxID=370345 RepID=A0ABD0M541_9CAEN